MCIFSCRALSRKLNLKNNSNKAERIAISIRKNETINIIVKEAYKGSAVDVIDIEYY